MREKMTGYALTALIVASTVGCSFLAPADSYSIKRAADSGDEAYLQSVCSGETNAKDESNQKYACTQLEKRRAPGKVGTTSCEEIVSFYENASKDDFSFVTLAANRMAECGHYAYLFEHVVHWGNEGEGTKLLIQFEEGGKPVEAELVKYLAANQGPKFFAAKDGKENDVIYGLGHITAWLVKKGHTQHCAAIADAAKGASATARTSVMDYFKEAKCKEGIPVVMETLLDEEPNRREYSCKILGAIGDASVLDKVKILADTDGYSEVKEEEREGRVWAKKSYPVRDACLEAFGKIKLRN